MVVVAVLSHLLSTFQASFHNYWLSSFVIGYLFDILYLVDIFFKTKTAYLQGGFWVIFSKEMLIRYISSPEFKFDVMTNFPYDIFVVFGYLQTEISMVTLLTLVRLPKLMRTARVAMYFRSQEQKLHASFTIQILKFLTYLIIMTHTIACVWYSLACPYGETNCLPDSWYRLLPTVLPDGQIVIYDVKSLYIVAVYWTGKGYLTTSDNHDNHRIWRYQSHK